jgi:predicted ArsR family transcriptional regulator
MSEPDLFDICARKHGGNPESQEANRRVSQSKENDRMKILEHLKVNPMTVDEVAMYWDTTPNAVSGRFSELKKMGLIKKVGTRPTRSGSPAGVYAAI